MWSFLPAFSGNRAPVAVPRIVAARRRRCRWAPAAVPLALVAVRRHALVQGQSGRLVAARPLA
eukprot:1560657-Pyramimonas_sp.AAC.1